jgi:hypothetical protein
MVSEKMSLAGISTERTKLLVSLGPRLYCAAVAGTAQADVSPERLPERLLLLHGRDSPGRKFLSRGDFRPTSPTLFLSHATTLATSCMITGVKRMQFAPTSEPWDWRN